MVDELLHDAKLFGSVAHANILTTVHLMEMAMIKLRLRHGNREIEVEGSRNDVDELLNVWWAVKTTDDGGDGDDGDDEVEASAVRRSRNGRKKSRSPSMPPSGNGAKFDSQPLVNAMRENQQYDLWETKVLHAKDALAKVKLVCWYAKQPLTSGDIHRVLGGLDVRISLPRVSEAIKRGISNFTQDGARVNGAIVRYKLTGKAEKDFQLWLNGNE